MNEWMNECYVDWIQKWVWKIYANIILIWGERITRSRLKNKSVKILRRTGRLRKSLLGGIDEILRKRDKKFKQPKQCGGNQDIWQG